MYFLLLTLMLSRRRRSMLTCRRVLENTTTARHQTARRRTPPVLGMPHYPAHPALHASARHATLSTTRASPARTAKTEGTACSRSGCGFMTSRNAQAAMHPLSTVQGATTSRAHAVARIHAGNVSRRSLRAKVFTTTCEKFTAVSVSNFIRSSAVSMYCILCY